MKISDFDYELPESFIAQTPLEPRDHSKLMVLNRKTQSMEHHQFFELPDLLDPQSVLVFNQSKVIPARLQFKLGQTDAEILLIKPVSSSQWECMVRPGPKFKVGQRWQIDQQLAVEVQGMTPHGLRVISFEVENFNQYLEQKGQMPLPPYIKEELKDKDRYQTIYAQKEGSVAAPTAGLHFTSQVFDHLKAKGIETAYLTLHVGLGTFQPVKVEEVKDHQMHTERYELTEDVAAKLNHAKSQGKKIVAVGTTTVRVLETCADQKGILQAGVGETDIFIHPGYQWKFVDQLITNFHLPKSTLMMLVSSLAGRELIMKAYETAKKENYRFFSFGDAMWIK